jgi:hypothetical protein
MVLLVPAMVLLHHSSTLQDQAIPLKHRRMDVRRTLMALEVKFLWAMAVLPQWHQVDLEAWALARCSTSGHNLGIEMDEGHLSSPCSG